MTVKQYIAASTKASGVPVKVHSKRVLGAVAVKLNK